jgi:hypothetical protein
MTPPDDRRAPRTANGAGPRRGDAAPLVASLPPVHRYLILLTTVLSATSLAFALAAITRGDAPARVGNPARQPVSGCLTPTTAPGRDEMPQWPARRPLPADSPPAVQPAAAVLGCHVQLI